jgi:hypothetical protein
MQRATQELSVLKSERANMVITSKQPEKILQLQTISKTRLSEAEKFISGNYEQQIAALQQDLHDAIENQLNVFDQVHAQCRVVFDATLDTAIVESGAKNITTELQSVKHQIREALISVEDFKTRVKDAAAARDQAHRESERAQADFKELEVKAGGKKGFEEVFRQVAVSCPEATLDEVNLRIESLRFDLDAAVDNPEVVTRFNNAERDRDVFLQQQIQLQVSSKHSE